MSRCDPKHLPCRGLWHRWGWFGPWAPGSSSQSPGLLSGEALGRSPHTPVRRI